MNHADQRFIAALSSRGQSSDFIKDLAIKCLAKYCPVGHLLDFGAGQGLLVRRIYSESLAQKITCVDFTPRPEGISADISWIEANLDSPLRFSDSMFDVVVSTEVIEHLENPRAAFREIWRVLRPGGQFILTTPNQESLRSILSLIFARHFAAFLGDSYPSHIVALLEMDLRRICLETGFIQPFFRYTDSGRIPKLPYYSWPSFFKGRLFSDNIALVAQKPRI